MGHTLIHTPENLTLAEQSSGIAALRYTAKQLLTIVVGVTEGPDFLVEAVLVWDPPGLDKVRFRWPHPSLMHTATDGWFSVERFEDHNSAIAPDFLACLLALREAVPRVRLVYDDEGVGMEEFWNRALLLYENVWGVPPRKTMPDTP